jgi:ribonucleoside-diphosphate reductase alpha chain
MLSTSPINNNLMNLFEENEMFVLKRNGDKEPVSFDKILKRLNTLCKEANIKVNTASLVIRVVDQLHDNILTTHIDELCASLCASMATIHTDYNVLAGRIIISNHHKNTSKSFVDVMTRLYEFKDIHGNITPLISEELYVITKKYANKFDKLCDYSKDNLIDYFGFKTLERAYLMKINKKVVERPQHMWLRVSIGIHGDNYDKIVETYKLMSSKYFTHATPTLYNSGTPKPQLSSCFLLQMESDSIDGIFNTVKECAQISKLAGGIGLHIHNIRATGSFIRGTGGISSGIVPMLRVFNNTAKYVDQGGSKRSGSFAIYLEPWHADIELFLDMRKNHGDEELKARDLFYALWVPDLFMERVKANGKWTLMCPDGCPGLADVYGDDFVNLYTKYENENRGKKTVNARDLWYKVLDAQMETGTPYLAYKDAVNKKSNQKNIGVIKSSNLCVAPETLILTDKGHKIISLLEGKTVNVWNGEEFSETTIFKTGIDQELLEVSTSDGMILNCTPYHKFFIQNKYKKTKTIKFETIEAKNLKIGDKLLKCDYPIIDGKETMLYPYTHGFFCGDGTYRNNNSSREEHKCNSPCIEGHYFCGRHLIFETDNTIFNIENNNINDTKNCNATANLKRPLIYLYDEKKKLIDFFDYKYKRDNNGHDVLTLPIDINEKFYVPMNSSIKDKMLWFAGYADADGCITNVGTNQQLQICSINNDFLINVKLMLQTCGINPKISSFRDNRIISVLPDGKGGSKEYNVKPCYRLLITSTDLNVLKGLGFKTNRLILNDSVPNRSARKFITINSVINKGRIDDTYCFTEPKKNAGIFNGILTSQCAEITLVSNENETAVCNLASLSLPAFVDKTDPDNPIFNYDKLHEVTKVATYNLNRVIDVNYYPNEKTKLSNMRHRPIGVGVQGLADVFFMMNLPFTSDKAKEINRNIFETMYHASLEKSMELAITDGKYETFDGSPASQGILQFDMWGVKQTNDRYDWDDLKQKIVKNGLRNSMLLALMPTASSSQILGNNEAFEPITSNIYSRKTNSGDFVLVNKYLVNDLVKLKLWNEKIKDNIIANNGSVQQIGLIPEDIREKYKTVWEIKMKDLIDMSADRGINIDQTQSLNLFIQEPNYNNLTSMHFYGWSKGLKTGLYYLRRKSKVQPQQFTIEPELNNMVEDEDEEHFVCDSCGA